MQQELDEGTTTIHMSGEEECQSLIPLDPEEQTIPLGDTCTGTCIRDPAHRVTAGFFFVAQTSVPCWRVKICWET